MSIRRTGGRFRAGPRLALTPAGEQELTAEGIAQAARLRERAEELARAQGSTRVDVPHIREATRHLAEPRSRTPIYAVVYSVCLTLAGSFISLAGTAYFANPPDYQVTIFFLVLLLVVVLVAGLTFLTENR